MAIFNGYVKLPEGIAIEHGHLVGPRPLDGRGVVLGWDGGWEVGLGGPCINVHVNLHTK